MSRLKVLMSAYACRPDSGSELGVGWNVACEVARTHDVWVLTWAHHRDAIERELARRPCESLHFVYYQPPGLLGRWSPEEWGMQLHYYIWQLGVFPLAVRLHQKIGFDVAHHVTFVKYWQPTLLPRLRLPFLWGPVAGADSAPASFRRDLSWKGYGYEALRDLAVWSGEHDPLVMRSASGSTLALGATRETAERLKALGARRVEVFGAVALSESEERALRALPEPSPAIIRFVSMGRLMYLKAFHLGLRAFAAAGIADSEYWVVGDGPARAELERQAAELGIGDRVRFWGAVSRADALNLLGQCHVLVHPSLHDSGSYTCLEALAGARPVICLDLAGPAEMVTAECGIKVEATEPRETTAAIARAMTRLAGDAALRARMGVAGRARVASTYRWDHKGRILSGFYERMLEAPSIATAAQACT